MNCNNCFLKSFLDSTLAAEPLDENKIRNRLRDEEMNEDETIIGQSGE